MADTNSVKASLSEFIFVALSSSRSREKSAARAWKNASQSTCSGKWLTSWQ